MSPGQTLATAAGGATAFRRRDGLLALIRRAAVPSEWRTVLVRLLVLVVVGVVLRLGHLEEVGRPALREGRREGFRSASLLPT